MAILNTPTDALDRVDWNFPSTGTYPRSVHAFHWFPGNFIPQIPSALIQVLSKPGDLVLDPFAGSGTTGVEALKLGRRVVLSDRIRACTMVARGKLDMLFSKLDRQTTAEVLDSVTWEHLCYSDSIGANGEGSDTELEMWYAPGTLAQLRYLWQQIERQRNPAHRRILTLIFSDVLFACASPGKAQTVTGKRRRHHWGWVADNVHPRQLVEQSAVQAFTSRLLQLATLSLADSLGCGAVVRQDARQLALKAEAVDLVVTSPPYVGVIDYTRANRLLYLWMKWNSHPERANEIGARFKRWRRAAGEEYLSEMWLCWQEVARVMRGGAHCAIVIGESKRYVGAIERTMRDAQRLMPLVWGPVVRSPSRRRVSERAAREPVEYVYVLRKP